MKTKTIITDITHEDLVNLLSTASEGSNWLTIDAKDELYYDEKYRQNGTCIEDILAEILLDGKTISVSDHYSEDGEDFYGDLPHHWNEDWECMDYEVNLDDIAKGIARALDNDEEWDSTCAMNLIEEEVSFDIYRAEELVQVIVFGKAIYG